MSLDLVPSEIKRIVDPIINLPDVRDKIIYEGGNESSYVELNANGSGPYTSQINFTAPPPSLDTILNRKAYLKLDVTITFQGTGAGGPNLLVNGYDGFRAFPIAHITKSVIASMNGNQLSSQPSYWIDEFLRYMTPQEMREYDLSLTPTMLDQSQTYASMANSTRNPLALYKDSYECGRGGFPMTVVQNTSTNAEIRATLVEPVFLSPFCWSEGQKSGMSGLHTLNFNFILESALSRIWSHDASSPKVFDAPGPVVSITNAQMLFNYVTPRSLEQIPKAVSYPYYQINAYNTQIGDVTAGEVKTSRANNIILTNIPKKIVIVVARQYETESYVNTDTFLAIRGISINWGNKNGLYSGASQEQLYNVCVKNGCTMSYTQWRGKTSQFVPDTSYGTVGSVMCFDLGYDFPLEAWEAPGINGNYNFTFTITYENTSSATIPAEIRIYSIPEGTAAIIGGQVITTNGDITRKEVLDAQLIPAYDQNEVKDMRSAGFLSGIKDFYKGFRKGLREVGGLAKDFGGIIEPFNPLLKLASGGAMSGGAMSGGAMTGGALTGGKMMSRQMLKQRMSNY